MNLSASCGLSAWSMASCTVGISGGGLGVYRGPIAHATMSGNSSRQNPPPCDPTRSVMTTSAPPSRSATAHRAAFPRKNDSSVPATRYVRGIGLGITTGGRYPGPGEAQKDRTVDVRMPKPDRKRQLSTC